MRNDLLLFSGNDIPYYSAQLTVHQPTINEISYIGEQEFYSGCELLTFSKESLSVEDKSRLKDVSDFEILLAMMTDRANNGAAINTINALMVLAMIFPDYQVRVDKEGFNLLHKEDAEKEAEERQVKVINKDNYDEFRKILVDIFCLDSLKKDSAAGYNPKGDRAAALVEKFKEREKILAQKKGAKENRFSILERYCSILSVGESKDINTLLEYTIYQLFDEFERFQLKQSYDIYLSAKMAGASGMEEVDNWMKDLH